MAMLVASLADDTTVITYVASLHPNNLPSGHHQGDKSD